MKTIHSLFAALVFAAAALALGEEGRPLGIPRTIEVRVTVPDSAWKLVVEEVREVDGELWVVSRLSRDPDAFGAQVITELKALAPVDVAGRNVKSHVLGKTWNWDGDGSCIFINDVKELGKAYAQGRVLYPEAK